jgi:hypothetical protein
MHSAIVTTKARLEAAAQERPKWAHTGTSNHRGSPRAEPTRFPLFQLQQIPPITVKVLEHSDGAIAFDLRLPDKFNTLSLE